MVRPSYFAKIHHRWRGEEGGELGAANQRSEIGSQRSEEALKSWVRGIRKSWKRAMLVSYSARRIRPLADRLTVIGYQVSRPRSICWNC